MILEVLVCRVLHFPDELVCEDIVDVFERGVVAIRQVGMLEEHEAVREAQFGEFRLGRVVCEEHRPDIGGEVVIALVDVFQRIYVKYIVLT